MDLEGQHLKEIWPAAIRQILPVGPHRAPATRPGK